jgi:hypothetical protein
LIWFVNLVNIAGELLISVCVDVISWVIFKILSFAKWIASAVLFLFCEAYYKDLLAFYILFFVSLIWI